MAPQLRKPKAGPGPRLTVVWRRIEVLRPDSASPRSHSPTQISQLARSISSFGFNVPILVDPMLRIIAGHGRLLAAQELGWREVPTILLDHLSPVKARAFMIADNRLAEGAAWNDGLLLDQLKELPLTEPDLAIEVTGFELEGINLRRAVRPRDMRRRSRPPVRAAAPPEPPAAPVTEAEEAPALMPAGARG
jgi:ParB-like chromosome segregation protein Spo0J